MNAATVRRLWALADAPLLDCPDQACSHGMDDHDRAGYDDQGVPVQLECAEPLCRCPERAEAG